MSRKMVTSATLMAPGMMHCGGGQGPNQFNAMAALERWLEKRCSRSNPGSACQQWRARQHSPPLSLSTVAVYNGVGSTNDAGKFVCSASASR
jgi:feruloyl esterase